MHRRALAELDRDFAEGRLDAEQHESARLDLERRLLEDVDRADVRDRARPPRRATRALALAVAIALPLAAFGLYARFGNPGGADRRRPARRR